MLALLAAAPVAALALIQATTVNPNAVPIQGPLDVLNTPSGVTPTSPADTGALPYVPVQGLPPPELWRGARVGMTAAQVKALFPEARNAAPMLVTQPPVANAVTGGGAVWAVDEQVFGYPALATYYFGPTGLLEVMVSVKGLRLRHTRDNVDTAREVRAGLLRYYGAPKVCLDTNRRGLVRLDCRWVQRRVQVGLSYVDYGGLAPNLDVAVRAVPPKPVEAGATFARHGASF